MQIYTNFESNSQPFGQAQCRLPGCFRCKFTQILKAIHNLQKSQTTCVRLFSMQIYTNFESNSQLSLQSVQDWLGCFRCKFTQILKAIHNELRLLSQNKKVVFDANLHKFWKQFTTHCKDTTKFSLLFSMQIYTNFESNSQLFACNSDGFLSCFRCKFTQILKAIHNKNYYHLMDLQVVFDANLHKFWKQFTTSWSICGRGKMLFPMQIYTNFESNSQHFLFWYWEII